jgi:hypothetical protein
MNKFATGLILWIFAQGLPVAAQYKPENTLSPRMRIYEPKYMKRDRAGQVARFVRSVVAVEIEWEPLVNGLVLRAVTPKETDVTTQLDRAEELIKRFDVPDAPVQPERQIDMTVSLIRAITDANRVKGSVPHELADVVKELKGALPYAGFGIVDTIQLKVRNGLQIEDALPALSEVPGAPPLFYSLTFHDPVVMADGKTVSIGNFRFGVKVPVSTMIGAANVTYQDESIATPLTLYDGQKQVLGKVKLRSGDDLFVVLSCKVK